MTMGENGGAAPGVLEERFEIADAAGVRPSGLQLIGQKGRVNRQGPPRAGDRHIQPSMAAIAIERPEIDRKRAFGVEAESDREQHDIAFVALDVFQVLHHGGLETLVGEKPFQLRLLAPRRIQQVI